MCVSRTRRYAPAKSVPGAARNLAHALVLAALEPEGWGLADDVDLVGSELVSAALAEQPTWLEFTVDVHFNGLRVTVTHDGRVEAVPDPVATLRHSLLSAVTTDYARTERDGATVVSAWLRCDPEVTRSLACTERP
jgi:hypothetical protein